MTFASKNHLTERTYALVLAGVHIGNGVTLRRTIIDNRCQLPDGFSAGLDARQDRERGFEVTAGGVTLISPQMIGQSLHRLACSE